MKITTKTGDKGKTSLFGGRRVSKASRIIEVIGELDELQAVVGWCGAGARGDFIKILTRIEDDLYRIMSIVGFEFKCPKNIKAIGEADVKRLEKKIREYEALVETELKTAGKRENLKRLRRFCGPFLLKKFVRPGKSEISARLHIARTVCRRVERVVAGIVEGLIGESDPVPGNGSSHKQQTIAGNGKMADGKSETENGCAVFILKYLNRLSDLLFIMACTV